MKLSFIIPAYNASSTIVRTLDSIYTLPIEKKEFEVIVVDDCSTDDTLSILHNYASKQENMRVLYQEQNHRQGAARNRGLREAKGQYIMFVDADDRVEIGVCEAINRANKKCVDILVCDYDWQINNEYIHRHMSYNAEGLIFSGKDFLESFYDVVFNTCPINYLWSRSFLQKVNLPFIEDRRMEDIDWIERHIDMASTISYVPIIIYTVIGHPESTTHTTNIGTISDWLHFSHRRYEFAEEQKDELPQYYTKVIQDTPRFVIGNTRLRMLSNFSPRQIHDVYKSIGEETLLTLRRYQWPWQAKLFINYPKLELISISVLHPISKLGRIIVRKLRNYE